MIDDAIHIADPEAPGQTLCGQRDRLNVKPYEERWSDYSVGGQGCWTCLDVRAEHERSKP